MSTVKLQTKRLRKTYGAMVAVGGSNLELEEGSFLTLLGPSGSGKSTLLMMISGLIQPDEGDLLINGRNCTFLPPEQRDIGMVFQNYALFPHMSVFDNIAFPLAMRGRPAGEIQAAVSEMLGIVQMGHLADRLPRQLSGGQQQRIALARAMVYRPSIILMDEPLGALDKKLREQLQVEIKELQIRLGITVVYVTHDQEEALSMSDNICLMREGEEIQVGTPHEMYFQPRTAFAARFLGDSNLFDVRFVGEDHNGLCLVEDAGGRRYEVRKPGFDPRNATIQLMVRPESMRIAAAGDEAGNSIPAHLERVTLTGAVTRCHARDEQGRSVAAALLTRSADLPSLGPVRLCWDARDGVLVTA